MGKKVKFYAVAVGRSPGVFHSWDECERQVKGFRGAVFKSFLTEQDAKDYVTKHGKAVVTDWPKRRTDERALPTATTPKTSKTTTTTTTTTTITTTAKSTKKALDSSSIPGHTIVCSELQTSRPLEEDWVVPPDKKQRLTGNSTASTSATSRNKNNPFTDISNDMSILMHFDGGSRGNPGVAGSGAHIVISRRVPPENDDDDDDDDAHGRRLAGSTMAPTGRTVVVSRSTIRLQRFLEGCQTNNQAEYWGLITGLECVYEQLVHEESFWNQKKNDHDHEYNNRKRPWTLSLTIQGDSKLVVQQMNGAWKVGDILHPAYLTAQQRLHRIQELCRDKGVVLRYTLSHVYRNENKDADECANLSMDAQRSWVIHTNSEGVETRTELSDVVSGDTRKLR